YLSLLCLFFSCSFSPCPASSHFSTLSLHDALPILIFMDPQHRDFGVFLPPVGHRLFNGFCPFIHGMVGGMKHHIETGAHQRISEDRKSTRLNSSHVSISYAVFCLKKKNKTTHKRL